MKYKIMPDVIAEVAGNLANIRTRMSNAVKNRPKDVANKDPLLVAVSKTKSLVAIKKAYDEGQRHFGENYLKELVMKSSNPDMSVLCPDIKWHYIGSFQTKMASQLTKVANLYSMDSLCSKVHADAINTRWKLDEPLKVSVQVNTSGEESKSGIQPDECVDFASYIHESCSNLKLHGLMTIGSPGHDYSKGPNPDFVTLTNCRRDLCKALNLQELDLDLSMGMSSDFEEAINAGSTVVRIGSSIFGERDYPNKTNG